jgi:hypothetical protein
VSKRRARHDVRQARLFDRAQLARCLIAVSVGLVRTLDRDSNVIGLFLGEGGELGTERVQVQAGDLLVEALGKDVDLSASVLVAISLLVEFQLGKHLVGERRRHDERRVTSGTSQVKKTSLSKDNDSLSVRELEFVNLGLDVDSLGGLHESIHVNFVIKVTNVSNNSVVLHLGHVFTHENTLVTSGGDENIGVSNNILKGGDGVTFHAGLERTDGVDLGDVDNTSVGTHGGGTSLTDISVSADDGLLSGKHDIGGTHDTIGKRVLASVKVVELGLGHRVVNIDGGEKKSSSLLHGVKTVDTSGGLLRNSVASGGNLVPLVGLSAFEETSDDAKNDLEFSIVGGVRVGKSSILKEGVFGLLSLVDNKSHVTSIINNKVRSVALAIILLPGEGVQSAFPVFLKRFSLPSKNGGGFIASDSSGGVILGREDVTRAPTNVSSKSLQGLDEDGGLDGHVEGSRDTGSLEGLFLSEFLSAGHKPRHLYLGKLYILSAIIGEGNVGNYRLSKKVHVVRTHHPKFQCGPPKNSIRPSAIIAPLILPQLGQLTFVISSTHG